MPRSTPAPDGARLGPAADQVHVVTRVAMVGRVGDAHVQDLAILVSSTWANTVVALASLAARI